MMQLGQRLQRWARIGVCAVAVALVSLSGAMAEGTGKPAELPPASYAGMQYVDSEGCVFLRAGTEAETIWVPRVTSGGKQICGYPPSGERVPVEGETGADTREVAPEDAPEAAMAEETVDVEQPKAAPEPVVDKTQYFVALGSFGFLSNIKKAEATGLALGYPVAKGRLDGVEQGLTTVFVGPFEGRAAAHDVVERLRQAGYPDAILIKG